MERLVLNHVSLNQMIRNSSFNSTFLYFLGTAVQKLPPQPEQDLPQLEVVQSKDVTDHVQIEQKSSTTATTVVESSTTTTKGS